MKPSTFTTTKAPLFTGREPAALDAMETQFFERCRRNATNVSYLHHIPVPRTVHNFQRRGLAYQSASGGYGGAPLPMLSTTIALPLTTCPVSGRSLVNQTIRQQPNSGQEGPSQPHYSMQHSVLGDQIMAYQPPAARKERQAMRRELSTVHRQNLQRRLHHRLEVARADGNQELIQQLEREMNVIS